MKEIIFVVEESFDGGYEARALGHSIFTQAEDQSELRLRVLDAVRCHFDEEKMPQAVRLHFVRDVIIAI